MIVLLKGRDGTSTNQGQRSELIGSDKLGLHVGWGGRGGGGCGYGVAVRKGGKVSVRRGYYTARRTCFFKGD